MSRRYNGGVRNLEDLRGRCVVDEDTGCWHLRDSKGRPLVKEARRVPSVFFVDIQKRVSARRLSFNLSRPKPARADRLVAVTCGSWDCVAPHHAAEVTPGELGAMVSADGRSATPAKRLHAMRTARSRARTKLTMELATWARESSQKQADVAHALDTTQQRISEIRSMKLWKPQHVLAGASVFAFAGSAG